MSRELLVAAQKTPLKGPARLILMAFCNHFRAHDLARRWAIPSIAEEATVSDRTVQNHLPRLIADGYITRRDERRDPTRHHAPEFTLTNPANWPAKATATRAGGAADSPGERRAPEVVNGVHPNPVLIPLEVTDVTSLSPAGDRASVEEKPKAEVICLSERRTGLTLTHVVALYHRHCPELRSVVKLDDPRRRALSARVREDVKRRDPQWWGVFFRLVAANDLLNGTKGRRDKLAGKSDRQWAATFDWLLCPTNMRKVVEGNYDDTQREFASERDPADDPAPATSTPEVRHAVG